jgi:hypothetical protein
MRVKARMPLSEEALSLEQCIHLPMPRTQSLGRLAFQGQYGGPERELARTKPKGRRLAELAKLIEAGEKIRGGKFREEFNRHMVIGRQQKPKPRILWKSINDSPQFLGKIFFYSKGEKPSHTGGIVPPFPEFGSEAGPYPEIEAVYFDRKNKSVPRLAMLRLNFIYPTQIRAKCGSSRFCSGKASVRECLSAGLVHRENLYL